jgi:predicted dehydrogenase
VIAELQDRPSPATEARKPRIGFLGVGWIGRHRMAAMLDTGAVEAAAIADPSPEMIAEAQALAPGAALASGLDELLDRGLDALVIATPSALHADQTIRALERGVAVFCQKPLGRTAAECAAAVAAAKAADRLLGVDLSYRFTEAARRVREQVRAGALGQLFGVDLVFHNAYGPGKPWFYDPALSGGGCVIDLGVHLVDLALWMLDFPEVVGVSSSLRAKGGPVGPGQVEDYAVATLELANGAVAKLACSWNLHAGQGAAISADFYGTEGGAGLRNLDGSFFDFTAEASRGDKRETLAAPPDDWGGRAAADWARRLAEGGAYDSDVERIVDVARVLDRIYGR